VQEEKVAGNQFTPLGFSDTEDAITSELQAEREPVTVKEKIPAISTIELQIEKPVEERVAETEGPGGKIRLGLDTRYDPTLDLPNYKFPTLDLLRDYGGDEININKEELEANKNRIVQTLNNYSIKIDKIKATIGPAVTLYEIVPEAGVRISKIKNLEDDIALSLSALGIRIIAPIPGKGTIGIEVPNKNPETVSMKSLLASERFQKSTFDLPLVLGKTISNETFIVDLAKMPHILMAGATGQGKSVGLNTIITSLLYKKHPSQIKFVMVDPKKVELSLFSKIERHFLAKLPDSEEAIITDTKKVIRTLNSLNIEMDNRYDLLQSAQVRNIKEYNEKFIARKLNPENDHHFLPYLILVVDEFADLIMTAGREIETPLTRLAQLARAVGIHLVIATQRPSVNIITGTIKANFPARIAFRVISKIDSRTILDTGGADQLVGRGDMLLSTGSDLIRLQCAFVDTPEIETLTDFIGSQRGFPDAFHLPEFNEDEPEGSKEIDPDSRDALFAEAARLIVQNQQGSTSLIQRKLKLGYNRAGRIIDQLESAGIVGPFEGSKARDVRYKDLTQLEIHLREIGEI
jgi:S-DNA-T family DNA segregation ATPase FtsK/SpoIIIE